LGFGFLILSAAALRRSPQLLFGLVAISGPGLVFVRVLERVETPLIARK
jgi:ABC-type nitrate/sulfonate/bicarbonate transport system permease component